MKRNGKFVMCGTCNKEFYVPKNRLERDTRLYCSKKCKYEGLKIKNNCKICGILFWKRSLGNKPIYCSRKCMGIGKRTGKLISCALCDREVYKFVVHLRKNKTSFCSLNCANIYQGRNKLVFVCKICKEEFKLSASLAKQRNPTYCSLNCRNNDSSWLDMCIRNRLLQSQKKGLNKLELKGGEILRKLGIEFYEQVLMFNKFLVDVMLKNKQVIIQWDGEYWHSQSRRKALDISQDIYLTKCGYKVLRITDKQIKNNLGEVYENIRNTIQQSS